MNYFFIVKLCLSLAKIYIQGFLVIAIMNEAASKVLERIFLKLGNLHKPIYPVMMIAAVKGICRPAFTMMDKTEEPETKRYTALREGLTEIIAIPTYFACGKASASLSRLFPEKIRGNAATNLMFMGVCGAALFAIPALCSVAIKPIMDVIHKKKNPQPQPILLSGTVKPTKFPVTYHNNFHSLNSFSSRLPDTYRINSRIGGV